MGLGKSVQAIGLILANPPEGRDYDAPLSAKPAATKPPSKAALKKLTPAVLQRVLKDAHATSIPTTKGGLVDACVEGFKAGTITLSQYNLSTSSPKTTLIVCPVTVMQNWVSQIETHVKDDTLRVALYHGPNRHELLNQLGEIDVLISSYQTISYDFSPLDTKDNKNGMQPAAKKRKQSSILFESHFHRYVSTLNVVCDCFFCWTNMYSLILSCQYYSRRGAYDSFHQDSHVSCLYFPTSNTQVLPHGYALDEQARRYSVSL